MKDPLGVVRAVIFIDDPPPISNINVHRYNKSLLLNLVLSIITYEVEIKTWQNVSNITAIHMMPETC